MAEDQLFELVPANSCVETGLFIDSLIALESDFYDCICSSQEPAMKLVSSALELINSDLGGSEILSIDGEPVGLLVRFPCAELMFRQLTTLKLAISLFGPLSEGQKEFVHGWGKGVPPVPKRGTYISKFVVRDIYRRRGFGENLLKLAVATNATRTEDIYLHVRKENSAAHAFYERNGFEVVSSGVTHQLMRRRPGD